MREDGFAVVNDSDLDDLEFWAETALRTLEEVLDDNTFDSDTQNALVVVHDDLVDIWELVSGDSWTE